MKKSNTSSPCQHISIAHSKLGEVLVCPECGVVHMALQSVSIRFDAEAFKVLSEMLSKAQQILDNASNYVELNREIVNAEHFEDMSRSKMH